MGGWGKKTSNFNVTLIPKAVGTAVWFWLFSSAVLFWEKHSCLLMLSVIQDCSLGELNVWASAHRPLVGSVSALATEPFLRVILHVSTLANASSFPCPLTLQNSAPESSIARAKVNENFLLHGWTIFENLFRFKMIYLYDIRKWLIFQVQKLCHGSCFILFF